MKIFVNFIRLIPKGLRFITLAVLSGIGFVLFLNGVTDGATWTTWPGLAISLLCGGFLAYLEVNHTDI